MEGVDQFVRKLRDLDAAAKEALRTETRRAASEMVTLARTLAPHRTSALRSSIQANEGPPPAYSQGGSRDGIATHVSVGNSDVRYSHLVEFGTRPHAQPNNPWPHHPGAKRHPFFWPAFRAQRRAFNRRMAKAMREAIRKGGSA